MKKLTILSVLVLALVCYGNVLADGAKNVVEGTLKTIEDKFYVIEDAQGKLHRLPYSEKTRKRGGKIVEGIKVEAYIRDEKVSMIEVLN